MSALYPVVHPTDCRHTVRGAIDGVFPHSRNRTERWKNSGAKSLAEIPLLVTSDKHLLNIDEDALLLAFNEADLSPVHPVHPKRLLRVLR